MGHIALSILRLPYGQVWLVTDSEASFGFGSS